MPITAIEITNLFCGHRVSHCFDECVLFIRLFYKSQQAHLESNQEHNFRRIGLYPFNYEPMRLLYHSLGQSSTQGAHNLISPPRTDWA